MKNEPAHVAAPTEASHRLAIQDVLVRHSRGLDRGEVSLLRCVYWEDAKVDYGSFVGNAHEFAEMVVPLLQEKYAATQHKISTTLISLRGERARAETYVTAHHLHREEPREMIFHGRYLDLFERRLGVWKILHRRVVMDWHRFVDVEADPSDDALAPIAKGARGKDDASSKFFGEDS